MTQGPEQGIPSEEQSSSNPTEPRRLLGIVNADLYNDEAGNTHLIVGVFYLPQEGHEGLNPVQLEHLRKVLNILEESKDDSTSQ